MLKKLKKKLEKFLDVISEQNEKEYGSGRMDCCELNKSAKKK